MVPLRGSLSGLLNAIERLSVHELKLNRLAALLPDSSPTTSISTSLLQPKIGGTSYGNAKARLHRPLFYFDSHDTGQ